MKKTIAVLAFGLMLSGVASSASAAVSFSDAESCGNWVKYRADKGWEAYASESWLMGYLSGMAVGTDKDILKGTDNSSIYLWMDNYCKENPLKATHSGGVALYYELVEQKGL